MARLGSSAAMLWLPGDACAGKCRQRLALIAALAQAFLRSHRAFRPPLTAAGCVYTYKQQRAPSH